MPKKKSKSKGKCKGCRRRFVSVGRNSPAKVETKREPVEVEADDNSGESFRGFEPSAELQEQSDPVTSLVSQLQEELLFGNINVGVPRSIEVGEMAEKSRDFDRRSQWVFSGKSFSQWRERVEAVLAREGLKELTWDTPEEKRYRAMESKEQRYRSMRPYDRKQDKARDIIYEHVDDRHLDRIRDCVTAREMLDKLATEHQSKSDVAVISAFGRLDAMRYTRGADLKSFIDEYELRVREYRDLGGTMLEPEMIQRFHRNLPVIYDSVLDWLPLLPEEQRTFGNYREKVLEKHQRTSQMASENRRAPPERNGENSDSGQIKKREDGDHGDKKCFVCRGSGHIARDCPLIPKVEEKSAALSIGDEDVKKEDQKPKADWSKFRSTALQKPIGRPAPTQSM